MNPLIEKYLASLVQLERLPFEHVARYQSSLLERVVRHAREHTVFYRERLSCVFSPQGIFEPRRWRELPVLSRDEAAANAASMQAELPVDEYGLTSTVRTTGTVGVPLRFTRNGLNAIASWASWMRFMEWHGARRDDALCVIRPASDRHPISYPAGRSKTAGEHGPAYARHDLDFRTPVDQQIEWLGRHRAPSLVTTPSNALAIAYAIDPVTARGLGVERVFVYGETVAENTRDIIRDRLGAKLAAVYSCEEAGPLAAECSEGHRYHVLPHHAVIEVLDDEGNPSTPSEIGTVVMTSLYNYATPFIRYAIGDVAIVSDRPCVCGRPFPVLEQVVGRTRNAFVFPDGSRKWPRSFDIEPLRAIFSFREFQMVQTARDRIEFHYVADGESSQPEESALDTYARKYFHPDVKIHAVRTQALAREASVKFQQFISKVKED